MADTRVLIVGAGPTGLVLALWLARKGVPFRIVDRAPAPGLASRALVVQVRTLEFYRQLGIAEEVRSRGIELPRFHLWEHGEEQACAAFGDLAQGASPYSLPLSFPQDDHERFLLEKLAELGVSVEREKELTHFEETGDGIRATLRNGEFDEVVEADYLAGCDGAASAVRHGLGIGFPGGTYDQTFYVADVEATGRVAENGDLNFCLAADGFTLVFPVRSSGTYRLIGIVPPEAKGKETLGFDDVRGTVESTFDLSVGDVHWFSTYRVHHRVADRFRQGRAFLLGDAGHIHSPAGGQGMNTGIGDAVNLAWKLADVVQGRADSSLLDSYEPERIGFARSLVDSTDRVFRAMVGRNPASRLLRTWLLPNVVPAALGLAAVRRTMFNIVSQTRIHYADSPLSEGMAGTVHAGDRLPWVNLGTVDNFEPLRTLDWQIHVYGDGSEHLDHLGMPVHRFAWSEEAAHAGFAGNATYVVRPDGHVAFAHTEGSADAIRDYLEENGIRR